MTRLPLLRTALVSLLLFGLLAAAAAQPPPLFYAVISDTQKQNNDPYDDFRWAVEQVNELQPQFVLFPGDLTSGGSVNQYEHWSAVRQDLQVPLYACPGNHEGDGCARAEFRARFLQYTGLPTYYGRQLGGWQLFALDGVHFINGKNEHEGALSPEQLTWLRAELARLPAARPILVICHFPVLPQWRSLANGAELLDCFTPNYLVYTVTGHWHKNEHAVDQQGRLHLITGALSFSSDAAPIGYRLISTVGYDLYTAWIGRPVEEPLSLVGETDGAGPLTVAAPAGAKALAVRLEYQGGPLRVRIVGDKGANWAGVFPAAPESTQALVPLRARWAERLGKEGKLHLSVEPLEAVRVSRLALYTSPLAWEHYRLPSPPSAR